MSYGAIAAATAAADKRRQALLDEEEEMTQYSQDDLSSDWEFKIVRSGTAAFRKTTALNRLVEEEARAGWIMLEKLDDSRIRFKRPRRVRAQDGFLADDVDPYRTHYGASPTRYTATVLLVVGLILFLVLGAVLAVLVSR